jgi:hypothetical protein
MKMELPDKDSRKKLVSFACVVFLLLTYTFTMSGCATVGNVKNRDFIDYVSFSPDGKKILFDRRKGDGPYQIQVYDLESGALSAYQSPADEQWSMARYSFDGKSIVFSIYLLVGGKIDLNWTQIAVMDPDGKNVKKVTATYGVKIFPSFSHSGTLLSGIMNRYVLQQHKIFYKRCPLCMSST